MNNDRFQIITPKDLEDYRNQAGNLSEVCWPEFMLHDPVANENWHELFDRFEEYQFALLDTEMIDFMCQENNKDIQHFVR